MKIDSEKIKNELQKVGVWINDIYDLVNMVDPYPEAIEVLISLLPQEFKDIKDKEGVVRALAVKEAKGKANSVLIREYINTPVEFDFYRWAIGNTIYAIITESDVESIIPIVQDKQNGDSRQMFVAAFGKVKATEKIEDVLIKLLDETEVSPHALIALGMLKSKKAKERIKLLLAQPATRLIRKEAQKALIKIDRSGI